MYKFRSTTVSDAVTAAMGKKTQIPTVVAMMCDPALNNADYGAAVCRAAMGTELKSRSLKTWQNYVSAARAANIRAVVQYLDRLPSEKVLTDWLTCQLTDGGFSTAAEDVANWALGRDSRRVSHEKKVTKESEVRSRAIAVDFEAAKAGAKLYLREQYTNSNGVMTCQVCKAELPFKLPNGAYYFEAVEIADALGKRSRATFLALCPNHAAMFKYANKQRTMMPELVATAFGLEIDVVLAGNETTVQFTEMHLADMQACLEAEDADKSVEPQQGLESMETSPSPEPAPLTARPPLQPGESRSEIIDDRMVRVHKVIRRASEQGYPSFDSVQTGQTSRAKRILSSSSNE